MSPTNLERGTIHLNMNHLDVDEDSIPTPMMSSIAVADPDSLAASEQTKTMKHQAESTEANHDLPARTMDEAEEARHDQEKDDAATMAASEELKHTSISDRVPDATTQNLNAAPLDHAEDDNEMEEPVKAHTPEPDTSDIQDEDMAERITSPKKKRGRDVDEDARDVESAEVDQTRSSIDGVNGSRTIRSEPEKKRPRDNSAEPDKGEESELPLKDTTVPETAVESTTTTADAESESASKPAQKGTFGSGFSDKPQTSSAAFASSGFASLASSSSSPFGTLASSKPSAFGGNIHTTTSGFGAFAGARSAGASSTITTTAPASASGDKPALGFAFGSGVTSSGFGGLGSTSVFGSALSNGFAGGSGPKLSSFAAPTKESTVETKPAKAFGAPESGEDEGSDQEDSDAGTDSDDEERRPSPEEKRKSRIIKVEDGESSEATLLQIRAKLFALGSKEMGWKERGVGTLKINVPKSCINYDHDGNPEPGSFDISGLEDEEEDDPTAPRVPRLIMRQENTHRVILNTVIARAMEFQDKPSTSAAQIIFTAFEGDADPKPIQMLLKMSENNAKLFKSEISSIQREL